MIKTKFLLGLVTVSMLFTACEDKETAPIKNTPVSENKTETTVDKISNTVKDQIETATEKTEEIANDIQEATSPVVEDVKTKISEATAPIIKAVQEATSTPNPTILYKKCASCHGLNAEKKALNKSAIIKDWDAAQIKDALNGYKSGTYGKEMKGVMKSQVNTLSEKEIELLSEHIANFK
jgi:cytochrome c553